MRWHGTTPNAETKPRQPVTGPSSKASDTDLLAKVAQGNKSAMQQLYMRFHTPLMGFLRAKGADGDVAADVLHDAMLDVWRSAGRFEGRSSVKSWIFTIARNKFADRIRGRARLTLVEDVPEVIDESPSAEAVMENAQNAERVRGCVAQLQAAQQNAIRLAFFDELSYEEIAEIEGVPVGTIKSRVYHAKQALMHCLSRCSAIRAVR